MIREHIAFPLAGFLAGADQEQELLGSMAEPSQHHLQQHPHAQGAPCPCKLSMEWGKKRQRRFIWGVPSQQCRKAHTYTLARKQLMIRFAVPGHKYGIKLQQVDASVAITLWDSFPNHKAKSG